MEAWRFETTAGGLSSGRDSSQTKALLDKRKPVVTSQGRVYCLQWEQPCLGPEWTKLKVQSLEAKGIDRGGTDKEL